MATRRGRSVGSELLSVKLVGLNQKVDGALLDLSQERRLVSRFFVNVGRSESGDLVGRTSLLGFFIVVVGR